jgi:uncharacterized protein
MQIPCDATLLRIFIGHDDVYRDKPLYEEIVREARAAGMAGATVTRGLLAFGPGSQEYGILLRLSEDLPVIIEIIDSSEKIDKFLSIVDGMIGSGVVAIQPISVLRYGRRSKSGGA